MQSKIEINATVEKKRKEKKVQTQTNLGIINEDKTAHLRGEVESSPVLETLLISFIIC